MIEDHDEHWHRIAENRIAEHRIKARNAVLAATLFSLSVCLAVLIGLLAASLLLGGGGR